MADACAQDRYCSSVTARSPRGPHAWLLASTVPLQGVDPLGRLRVGPSELRGLSAGQVNPGTTRVFTIDQRWNPTVLKGWGDEDETIFGPIVLNLLVLKH